MKITKERTKPRDGSNSIGQLSVFSFSARMRDNTLFLGTPRNQIGSKINTVTTGGAAVILVTSIISFRIGGKRKIT